MKHLIAVLIVALLLSPVAVAASTWYISPSGSDANTCAGSTGGLACRSLQFVFTNKFACGDTIIARGGLYYLPLTEGGVTVTGKACSSGSAESTLVAFNYGWGAQLVPAVGFAGEITAVAVVNGSSACLNGFCGSYVGTVTVGAVCPGLAGADSTALNPTSVSCGSGFVATATVVANVITAINVSSPGTGYPPNVKIFAQTGEFPVFTDLLQIWDSTNCSGAVCGGGSATNCATGNTGVANGCLIVTNAADNNDPNFGGCTTVLNCNGWLANLPSALVFFDSFFYQITGNGISRRSTPVKALTNSIPLGGDTTMCKVAANQAAANVAFGCPSGGVAQPGGLFNCASQVRPCPPNGSPSNTWYGGYIQWEFHTSDLVNPHSLQIGDERVSCQEIWTYCQLRLFTQTLGSPNVAVATGPASADNGTTAGFTPGHHYYLRNRPQDIRAGQSYLDRCPTQWSGGGSCNSGTPESTWKMFTAADVSSCPGPNCENPQLDTVWVPQMAPPLWSISTLNNFQVIGAALQGGNYPLPATGIASREGQPNIPEMFVFGTIGSTTLMQNLTLEGLTVQHTGGEGMGFHGNLRNITVQDSAFVDGWGGLVRVGETASGTDVCSGGSQNIPSNFVFVNNLLNGMQREDPTGYLGLHLGDVAGWTIDHNDLFRSYIAVANIGQGLNLGAENGQLAYCMGNWVFSNNHVEGETTGGGTLAIGADFGLVKGSWNHSPSSPAASLFADPALVSANYTGQFFGNFIMHGACDPGLSNSNHCTSGLYGDQGAWGVNVYNNVIGYAGGESLFSHNSSVATGGTFFAAEWLPLHWWVHNNIFWGCGSNLSARGSVYRRGTAALGWAVIDQNIEVCDTSGNASGGDNNRQNVGSGSIFWSIYDQSDATITARGTPTCAGAISCGSPASATVSGCSGATVSLAVDSISGAFSGLFGVSIVNPGTACSSPTLNFTNCPGCAATLCVTAGSLVPCAPVLLADTTWAFKFGGVGNLAFDPRGNFPISGVCKTPDCASGSNLFATFPWLTTQDVGSINCDPKLVDPTYPKLDFHPTNMPCLYKINWAAFDYTTAGRTLPIIRANTPPNLYPAISQQIVPDSSYNPSYIVSPVTSFNAPGGSGFTVWK